MTYITGVELTNGNIFALKELCILFDVNSLRGQPLGIFRCGEKTGIAVCLNAIETFRTISFECIKTRAVARTLMGGVGVYSYIHVLPD